MCHSVPQFLSWHFLLPCFYPSVNFADTFRRLTLTHVECTESSVLVRNSEATRETTLKSRLEAASGYDSSPELWVGTIHYPSGYDLLSSCKWVRFTVRVGMIHRCSSYRGAVVFFLACFSRRSRSFCSLARSFLSFSMFTLKPLICFFSKSRSWLLTMPSNCMCTDNASYHSS